MVLAEEDALNNELEEKQQEAIATAIQEEESWLQALAQEQSTNIDTGTDTDSDLGVCWFFIFSLVMMGTLDFYCCFCVKVLRGLNIEVYPGVYALFKNVYFIK